MTGKEVEGMFTVHTPISAAITAAAEAIQEECPESREKATAFVKLQEAAMWANAALVADAAAPKSRPV